MAQAVMKMAKGVYWTSRAYDAKSLPRLGDDYVDEIMIGRLSDDDGCEYEFGIRWFTQGGSVGSAPGDIRGCFHRAH